ncbi:unnamed protein product [Schistosoma guineensis]|nr:unnamed protein product [Schistosoma guineensis]
MYIQNFSTPSMSYLYNKDNRDSEFTQQFVRLCKLLPQMTNVKPTSSSSSSRRRRRLCKQSKSIELNTNLHVGLHDSLVHLIHNDDDNNDYADITSATTFNEAIFKASIEC